MKQPVLKALANPARIFYVPYSLAVINFAVLFLLYIAVVVIVFLSTGIYLEPLVYFIIPLCVSHTILAYFSKRDPQIGQIISAMLKLFVKKIPRRLAA